MTNVTLESIGRSSLSVLVNDRLTDLPVIHGVSVYLDEKSEFYFLDDDANPLTLAFRIGIGAVPAMDPAMAEVCAELESSEVPMFRSQCRAEAGDTASLRVIKITFRCGTPAQSAAAGAASGDGAGVGGSTGSGSGSAAALEQSLEESGRAEVYSIYFEFNSDEIREESRQTLGEIAAILERRPEWRLSIEGHTDGIDSDEYNLDLSRRRAAAVSHALIVDYAVAGARLKHEGFGEARPVDTNETIEGRARNRRVELVRLP
jgi:outer membrane protein OmpA-like peptidoglycan-associated protein